MQAGHIGVGAPRVAPARPEVTITGTEFRNMQKVAADYQLELGPTSHDRMSLEEAFEALAAGHLDLEDMNGAIRYANPTETGHAIAKQSDLRHFTLLALDDGIHPAVVFTVGEPRSLGGGHSVETEEYASERYSEEQFAQGGELHVDMPRRQPEVIFHDGPPPAGYEQGFGHEPDFSEPQVMQRGRDFDDMEPPPMARGQRGEAVRERREPQFDREPMQRGPEMGFDGMDRSEIRMRPEDAPTARRVDGRGAKKPAEEPAGEDKPMKIGRVTLSAADHKELHDISKQSGIDIKTLYKSMRAPTNDERLYLRGQQPIIRDDEVKSSRIGKLAQQATQRFLQRDAEAQERLITIDPKDGGNPVLVSLAQKPSYLNLITGSLHALSAAPGIGGMIQAAGGALLAVAGAVASFLPFVKREHNVDMVRAGLKHMALGAIAVPTDYASGGMTWYARFPLALAMSVQDFAQFFRSRKASEALWLEVKGKPNAFTRVNGILDTVGSGAMAALGR